MKEVFIPIFDFPVCRRGGSEAGEREGRSEHVFTEAGVGVFRVERVDQECVVSLGAELRILVDRVAVVQTWPAGAREF